MENNIMEDNGGNGYLCLQIMAIAGDLQTFAETMAELDNLNNLFISEAHRKLKDVMVSLSNAMETVH